MLEDIPGMRHAGTGDWAGLFNSFFWIDRASGLAGALFTQVLPFFDLPVIQTLLGFESAVYAAVYGGSKAHDFPTVRLSKLLGCADPAADEQRAAQHSVSALARHGSVRPAVWPSRAHSEYPAAGRPRRPVPRGVLCSSHVLGLGACLLTGQYGHNNGMLGLAHRGWSLNDYRQHIVHTLRKAGYYSVLIGEQHISKRPDVIGYDKVVKIDKTQVETVAPAASEILGEPPREPFFLSVGFFETHREFLGPGSLRDTLYSLPPANLPDTPETRRDMAAYKASARSLDQGVGAVLDSLDSHGLADDTLIIFTTDHGLAFPGAKATLFDRGLGVMLILRGPGGFSGGKVIDGLVSHIDVTRRSASWSGSSVRAFCRASRRCR